MIGHPIFDELPIPHVLFCPILLDPPSPPKIGHHLCMFPYRKSLNNTDFGESKILCDVKPCILGTILVLKLGIGESTFAKSTFLPTFVTHFLKLVETKVINVFCNQIIFMKAVKIVCWIWVLCGTRYFFLIKIL